jgi:hopene-associated glycosyltransferase HpnB
MIELAALAAAGLSLATWIYLVLFRGGFWRSDQFLSGEPGDPPLWPEVVAVIPARNEADTIREALASHLAQDYPGAYQIVLIDDQSTDATPRLAAAAAGANPALSIIDGGPLPKGWTGKLWAVKQGLDAVDNLSPGAKYVLFTDADIRHSPNNLRDLVAKAESGNLALVSQMALLRCLSIWERLLIPAFVLYFQMLYPFRWVNDPRRKIAAGAGGCMLVNREILAKAGGLEKIRDRVIDDCALAQLLKPFAPVWLGLTRDCVSLRAYDPLHDIWAMVTRTAFVQLSFSALLLVGTVIAMGIVYLFPPVSVALGFHIPSPTVLVIGIAAWILMSACYLPTLRLYRQPAWATVFMPVSALLYTFMTLDSARRFLTGRPPSWRDRKNLKPPATEADR